ncbi:MAG TPA: hypothetical protein DIU07_19840 [Rhodobacteraceae bacterium]|nr:hypothetical protein [Paracoccaceae bacterium]
MLAEEPETLLLTQGPVEETLPSFRSALIGLVFSNAYIRLYRICASEAGRFPQIGERFFKAGPGRVRLILARYLENQYRMGEMPVPDADLAADQFVQFSFTRILTNRLCGVQERIDISVISRRAESATRAFLAIYAANPAVKLRNV